MFQKQSTFAIRKTLLGVGSVLIGLTLLAPNVSAQEPVANPPETSHVTGEGEETYTVTLDSPAVYEADPRLPLSAVEVRQEGQEGRLVYHSDDTGVWIEREAPTPTVYAVGTEPTVTVLSETKAETTYSLDESRDFGDNQVTPAVDGRVTKTTTYRVDGNSSLNLLDDTYRFVEEDFYHLDYAQDLPSDRVVIDKLFVADTGKYKELAKMSDEDKSLREKAFNATKQQFWDTEANVPFPAELLTEEDLQDPNLVLGLFKASFADLENVSSGAFASKTRSDQEDDYIANYFRNHAISDGLYADVKADYLRLDKAKQLLVAQGAFTEDLEEEYKLAGEMFQTLTRLYNNNKGFLGVDIEFGETSMPETDKTWLIERIKELPEELAKNLLKLRVRDAFESDTDVDGVSAIGLAYSDRKMIDVRYRGDYERYIAGTNAQTGDKEVQVVSADGRYDLLSTLMHELGHIIDYNTGMAYDDSDSRELMMAGLSRNTSSFNDIFERHFKPSFVDPYYRDNIEEAFAEGFSHYVLWHVYGIPYSRYILVNDDAFEVRAGEEGYDTAMVGPFEEAAYYFADIYHQLFEQVRYPRVDIDKETLEEVPVQHGRVIYGAKPTTETTTRSYATRYQADDSKAYGDNRETAGQEGRRTVRTSYILEGNQLKPVLTVLEDSQAVDKLVIKGTKTKVETVNPVAVTTEYVSDDSLEVGVERVEREGSAGYTTVTTTYTLDSTTGEVTGQSSSVVTPMVPRRVIKGTKTKVETVNSVAVTTEYVSDASLEVGVERVEREGSAGYTTVTTTYTLDSTTGEVTGNTTSEVTPMVTRLVRRGTKLPQETEAGTPEFTDLPSLILEESVAVQDGLKVKQTIAVTVDQDGTEVSREVITEAVVVEHVMVSLPDGDAVEESVSTLPPVVDLPTGEIVETLVSQTPPTVSLSDLTLPSDSIDSSVSVNPPVVDLATGEATVDMESAPTYSRMAKNHSLPKAGEAGSLLGLLGASSLLASLGLTKKKED